MLRTKLNLTRSEQIEHIARAAQLRAMGIDIEVPPLPSSAPAADFEIGDNYNFISNCFSDMILIIGARFTALASGIWQADQVAVSLPGQDPNWDFFDMSRGDKPLPGLALTRDQVLNDQLAAGVRLRRGQVLSGVLVLVGWDAHLPPEYAHGTHLRIEIALSDLSGAELRAKSTVYVNRRFEAELRTAAHQKKMVEGSGLRAGKPALSIMEERVRSSAEKSDALSAEHRKEMVKEMEKQAPASGAAERSPSDSIPGRAEPCSAPTRAELYGSMFQEQVMGWAQSSRKPAVNFMEEMARAAAETDAYFSALSKRNG